MNGDAHEHARALCSIGDLARRTGLTVKAIRFYSDSGLVPPADRTPTGYRLYGTEAVARLELLRTLRDLGIGLPAIRKVLDRELTLTDVASAHAEALAVQIRVLRLRHAVLTAVAGRDSTPEEMELMHQLATLSEDERRRLIADFLDSAFGGLDGAPAFAGIARSMTPELPEHPEPEQVTAWVELAELSRDPEFRAAMRRTAEHLAAERAPALRRDLVATVRDEADRALAAGIAPGSPEAAPYVAALTAHYARTVGSPDDDALRDRLLTRLEGAHDPRRERYQQLLAVINDWPAPESPAAAISWAVEALSHRPTPPLEWRNVR
ncbi:MerR family transcriptional regulator [Streptomyces beijiangensis]|uniref:MerR family transcriptional regulator n=1 Tax=Streptomyces beijiangensis TaxID=163361 RepID=A0A939F598_9ACTN|nr:MerR family transcriptional regulator [Streptomyces beijiangensis]MBO0511272.1 MerR family transcriptional regulator [Streptomyces beijiangensis]